MRLNDVFTSTQTVILRDGVCQNLSFQSILVKIFARRTLFPFRYFSIHVKMTVLLNYSAIEWVLNDVKQCAKQQRKASGITHERWPDFRHRKKKPETGRI